MALICEEIQEWIEEEISKPVSEWVEKTEQVCKDWPWPLSWICKAVTTLIEVVVWIIVKVGKWVARTVCKLVDIILTFVVTILSGLWDVIVGIFTLDWRRILDGLIQIGIGILSTFFSLVSIIFLGDTIDFIISEYERNELRDHVKKLLEAKYSGEDLEDMKDNLRIDHGAFGFRLKMTATRTFIDSETQKPDQDAPNLIILHESNLINLKELAGFEFNEGFWNRKRYKTIKKGLVVSGGGGFGEFQNPISENELNKYISSRGRDNPNFIVLPMTDNALETKLTASQIKGRQLGLMINWEQNQIEVIEKEHIVHNGFDTSIASSSLVNFLNTVILRNGSNEELCNAVAVGVFRYTDTLRGISACLRGSRCQDTHKVSGVTFIDNQPDKIWKYVPIHELGHYFGLCHTDGVDRIMFSPRQNSKFTWATLPNLLYFQALEPKFILDEAKQAWDYIVEHFPANCLKGD